MPDIFGRNVATLGGAFTSDRAKLVLQNGMGVLVQRLNLAYSQTITRLYEVGSNGPNGGGNIYYVGGRTQGQMGLDRVIGPQSTVVAVYRQYGDVCKARSNGGITLALTETDCAAGANISLRYTMMNAVITQVSIGVAAQDMIIADNTALIFSSLDVSGA